MSEVAEPRLRSAAEAILIVADEPVTTAAIAEALGLEDRLAEELLEDLAAEYRGERPGGRAHGVRVTHHRRNLFENTLQKSFLNRTNYSRFSK